jgi:hypothetical protein
MADATLDRYKPEVISLRSFYFKPPSTECQSNVVRS